MPAWRKKGTPRGPIRRLSRRRTSRGQRLGTRVGVVLALLTAPLAACRKTPDPAAELAVVDSVLIELGGLPAGALGRTHRWRLISSIGTGLPPPGFGREELPAPESRAVGLLEVYCTGCHWLPAPQMHSSAEWPLLLRRMLLRSEQVGERLGGPLTARLLGGVEVARGMGWTLTPSPEDADTLLAYLQAHALPVARPGELGAGPESALFAARCGICHETPSPRAHSMAEWAGEVIPRMMANMTLMGLDPLTGAERERILAFLSDRSASN